MVKHTVGLLIFYALIKGELSFKIEK